MIDTLDQPKRRHTLPLWLVMTLIVTGVWTLVHAMQTGTALAWLLTLALFVAPATRAAGAVRKLIGRWR